MKVVDPIDRFRDRVHAAMGRGQMQLTMPMNEALAIMTLAYLMRNHWRALLRSLGRTDPTSDLTVKR